MTSVLNCMIRPIYLSYFCDPGSHSRVLNFSAFLVSLTFLFIFLSIKFPFWQLCPFYLCPHDSALLRCTPFSNFIFSYLWNPVVLYLLLCFIYKNICKDKKKTHQDVALCKKSSKSDARFSRYGVWRTDERTNERTSVNP